LQATDFIWWNEHLPEVKTRIANLIAYFRPEGKAAVSKVVIVPSDELFASKDTGRSFRIGDTIVIMSHTENLDNVEHEFMHGIINPLTEKLTAQLPEEKIVALASSRLKDEEMYGNHARSLLNEELIRTYNDFIKEGRPVRTFADFKDLVDNLDELQFSELLATESRVKDRFIAMSIASLDDFRLKLQEYYDRYEKNDLRDKIYQLYKTFNAEKAQNPATRFEDFFSQEAVTAFS
jgi:hypothetical protein